MLTKDQIELVKKASARIHDAEDRVQKAVEALGRGVNAVEDLATEQDLMQLLQALEDLSNNLRTALEMQAGAKQVFQRIAKNNR